MKSIALIGWFGSTGRPVVCQPGELSFKGSGGQHQSVRQGGAGQFEMTYLSSPIHSGTANAGLL
jgi:predicted Rossmann fold nucleotide-binding protein DprA/Smf involved in DNA uptake